MTFEKQLRAFQANVDLIESKADSFRNNSSDVGKFDGDPEASWDGLGAVDAAVRASFRQMRSDLEAVSQATVPDKKEAT